MSGLRVAAVVRRGGFSLEVDVEVAAGEVVGVIGPNGAGKTTLFRALAGLDAISAGSISLDDQTLDSPDDAIFVPASARRVGVLFQDYRLFPHLSARDNVAFGLRSRGLPRGQPDQIAGDWMNRLGIAHLGPAKPGELSGGQAQRVAIARALATDPAMLLLDEPLSALDALTRLHIRTELSRHLAAFAGPTLLITHDPLEAMVMTDRLVVLESGRVVQTGSPADVARRPATSYIATLLGLNLYPGRLTDSAGRVTLDNGNVVFCAGSAQGEPATGRVLIAIRPGAIALSTRAPQDASPRNVWQGVVAGLEPVLDSERVRLRVEGNMPALVDITTAAVHALNLAQSTPVWLSAKATEVEMYPDAAATQ